ncbi:hypothetical protein BG000_011793 [Podila horticola]|nr:hypothetical protein BG000_011793 [Podila horticola]
MHNFKSSFALAALLAIITTSSLRTHSSLALAAPVGPPSSPPGPPPSSSAVANTPTCRQCLSDGLKDVDNCGRLTQDTPALPADETDPSKIQEYKTQYPEVVDCLCRASNPLPNSLWWVDACDDKCTVAVIKTQKKVLEAFSKQLSCNANTALSTLSPPSTSPPPPPAVPNSPPSAEILPTPQSTSGGTQGQDRAQ